jgi:hypothetical protein
MYIPLSPAPTTIASKLAAGGVVELGKAKRSFET